MAISALVAIGIVAAAPWDSPDAQPAPTTIPVPTAVTTGSSMTGDEAVGDTDDASGDEPANPLLPASLLDPVPTGMAVRDVYPGGGDTGLEESWGEVWATADASASSGAWFSLFISRNSSSFVAGYGASRIDLGGRIAFQWSGDDGTLWISAPAEADRPLRRVQMSSSGLTADEAVTLFASIGIDDGGSVPADRRPARVSRRLAGPAVLTGRRPRDEARS